MADKIRANSEETIINSDIQLIKKVKSHKRKFNWISFHPNLEFILSCDYEGMIQIWSSANNGADLMFVKYAEFDNYLCVEAHRKGGLIVSTTSLGRFKVVNMDGYCVDTYITKNERQSKLDCHKTLPLVALATNKSLVILSLNNSIVQ